MSPSVRLPTLPRARRPAAVEKESPETPVDNRQSFTQSVHLSRYENDQLDRALRRAGWAQRFYRYDVAALIAFLKARSEG